jgi:hypothetical protein
VHHPATHGDQRNHTARSGQASGGQRRGERHVWLDPGQNLAGSSAGRGPAAGPPSSPTSPERPRWYAPPTDTDPERTDVIPGLDQAARITPQRLPLARSGHPPSWRRKLSARRAKSAASDASVRTVPNLQVVRRSETERRMHVVGLRGRHRVTSPQHARRWRMLPLVLSAMSLAQFDFFAVNIAAPALQRDLGVSDAALELVVAGYAFTFASGMVTGGRLGNLYGYRRLFLGGTASFLVASVLCAVAATPAQLVGARLLQGLTGAAMVPQVLVLITATFPADERPRALSWFGITGGFSAVAGQLLGGVLLDADLFELGWRTIFLINAPIGLVVLVLAARTLPQTQRDHRRRLDPIGAVGLSGSLALALVPLALGREQGWPAWTWVSLMASVPALVMTVRWERRLALRAGNRCWT